MKRIWILIGILTSTNLIFVWTYTSNSFLVNLGSVVSSSPLPEIKMQPYHEMDCNFRIINSCSGLPVTGAIVLLEEASGLIRKLTSKSSGICSARLRKGIKYDMIISGEGFSDELVDLAIPENSNKLNETFEFRLAPGIETNTNTEPLSLTSN